MLGNNADQFFTTPMRTSVLAGGNSSFASGGGMPAPYGSGSSTREFLPGMADAQIAEETTKLFGVGLPVIIGIAALTFFALKRA